MNHQVLFDTQLLSNEFACVLPSHIRIEGDLTGETVQLQSRRKEASVWNTEYTFSNTDKSCLVSGIDGSGIIFRISTSAVGLEAWHGVANISFPAR